MPDDHSKSVPPLPIPNRTVTRLCADDSAATSVKVGYRQANYSQKPAQLILSGLFAFLACLLQIPDKTRPAALESRDARRAGGPGDDGEIDRHHPAACKEAPPVTPRSRLHERLGLHSSPSALPPISELQVTNAAQFVEFCRCRFRTGHAGIIQLQAPSSVRSLTQPPALHNARQITSAARQPGWDRFVAGGTRVPQTAGAKQPRQRC